MNKDKVNLGKVSKKVQKRLNVSWDKCDKVYMPERKASSLVYIYPNTYLKVIDEVKSIVKQPDFIAYDESNSALYLFRIYLSKSTIKVCCVTLNKKSQFYFDSIFPVKSDGQYREFEGLNIIMM